MRLLRTVLALLLAAVAADAAAATFVVPTDGELVDRAVVIVTGTVVQAYSRLDERQQIETVYRIAVDETLKGEGEAPVIDVVEFGGRVGRRWAWACGAPRYRPGGRYLVFLARNRRGAWTTHDLTLGRFEFVTRGTSELLLRDTAAIDGWTADGARFVEPRREADRFLDFVRTRARDRNRQPDPFAAASARAAAVSIQPAPQFSGYDFVAAATRGVEEWTDDSGSSVSYSISPAAATGTTVDEDGEERIIEEDPSGEIAGSFHGSGVIATTFISGEGTHQFEGKDYLTILSTDVVTQNGVKSSGSFTQDLLVTTLVHEVGHTLGFRHADRSADEESKCAAPLPCSSGTDVMNSWIVGGLGGHLRSWDTAAVRAGYGSGGDASEYTLKFCEDDSCETFTEETGRRDGATVAFRLATLPVALCKGPAITRQPESVTIGAGQTTALQVRATASEGSLAYQWYRGQKGITTQPVSGGTTSLQTSPASTTSYWVRVTDGCTGSDRTEDSDAATVTVVCEPVITAESGDKSVSAGKSVTLSVTAPLAKSFQWYDVTATGSRTDESSPVAGKTSSGFVTPPLTATKKYWVKAITSCGFDRSRVFTVTVASKHRRAVRK